MTKPLERRRDALTRAVSPASSDVLRYLARGESIRRCIVETTTAAAPPVVVMAHSLGGIATVDALVATPVPGVQMVVTVGSQTSFLYEIGALPSMEFGASLPDHMPRWVNILDYRDLLAFVAEPLFPGKVTDCRIDNRVGFPRSHTAYFGNRELYALLDEVLP